jgi:hypothetical protein
MKKELEKYFEEITGGATSGRVERLRALLAELSPEKIARLRVEECCDEKSGRRFGDAKCRRGRAQKLGGGGRNRGSKYSYQVWAVWA